MIDPRHEVGDHITVGYLDPALVKARGLDIGENQQIGICPAGQAVSPQTTLQRVKPVATIDDIADFDAGKQIIARAGVIFIFPTRQ